MNSILVFFGLNLYTLLCFYHTPWFILFVLMLNGAFASLQFSAMNSGSYSNLSAQHQSMGTSFLSSFQQILQSFGIALSAFILSILLQGHNPTHYPAKFFALTYFALSLLPLISTYIFWQFKNLYAEPQLPTKTEIQTSAVD